MKKANSRVYQIRNPNTNYNRKNQSISEMKNRKSLFKKIPSFRKKTIILNSQIDNQNNLDNNIKKDKYHDLRIKNLLSNTKNFFVNLENYLEINKPEKIPYYNANKIYKELSRIKMKDIQCPKTRNNKESNINKLYGRMFSLKIMSDDNKNNNKTNKIINEYEIKNNNYDNNYINNKIKQIKLDCEQIIQTFNTQKKDNKDINFEKTYNKNNNVSKNIEINNNQKNNNINNNRSYIINKNRIYGREKYKKEKLPIINISKSISVGENNKIRKINNNNIKIAEIREVYPCYPFNRIFNISNTTRTFNNNKKYNQFCFDLKSNYVPDSRYYYEKIMDGIKFGNINFNKRYIYNKTIRRKSNSFRKVNNVFI